MYFNIITQQILSFYVILLSYRPIIAYNSCILVINKQKNIIPRAIYATTDNK